MVNFFWMDSNALISWTKWAYQQNLWELYFSIILPLLISCKYFLSFITKMVCLHSNFEKWVGWIWFSGKGMLFNGNWTFTTKNMTFCRILHNFGNKFNVLLHFFNQECYLVISGHVWTSFGSSKFGLHTGCSMEIELLP